MVISRLKPYGPLWIPPESPWEYKGVIAMIYFTADQKHMMLTVSQKLGWSLVGV